MKPKKIIGVTSDKTKQIIVARYRENASWLKNIENIPFIVYNKYKHGPNHLPNIPTFPVQLFEGIKHAKTPTGRETHTYLYHIIKHYHELADVNIFLQGNPFEFTYDTRDPLGVLAERDFAGINFLPLNFPLVICDKRAAPLHTGLPLERVFKRLFQSPCPELFAYSWGSMFCVTKEAIQYRSLEFYEEMMQIVYDEPLSGYIYERLWPAILGCPGFISHVSFPKKNRATWNLPDM